MSISPSIREIMQKGSWIRQMFEEGARLKALHGAEKVFDFYKEQIPEIYRGFKSNYLGFARLTNYTQTNDIDDTNLIPKEISSPAEVLLEHKFFDVFREKPKDGKIIYDYNSKIPHESKIRDRKDMFKN